MSYAGIHTVLVNMDGFESASMPEADEDPDDATSYILPSIYRRQHLCRVYTSDFVSDTAQVQWVYDTPGCSTDPVSVSFKLTGKFLRISSASVGYLCAYSTDC